MPEAGASALCHVPRSAEEFLRPLCHLRNIPEHAKPYMSLLRESTTSQSQMQGHILRLFARGAVDCAKVARLMRDPCGGITDICLDTGCHMLMKNMHQNTAASDHVQDHGSPDNVISQANSQSPGSDGEHSSSVSRRSLSPWSVLRLSVLGTSCFKKCKAKDDSSVPDNSVHPLHSKALSLMLSIMMSGASGSLPAQLPSLQPSTSNILEAACSGSKAIFSGMASMAQAQTPSLVSHNSAASGLVSHGSNRDGTSVLEAGGALASAALSVIRTDSRNLDAASFPANLLSVDTAGSILELFVESVEKEHRATLMKSKTMPRDCPSFTATTLETPDEIYVAAKPQSQSCRR